MADTQTLAIPLLVVGNVTAIVVIARFVPVVRERRVRWLLIHHAAMLAIIGGWAIRRPIAITPNAVWLVSSTVWYVVGGRRQR